MKQSTALKIALFVVAALVAAFLGVYVSYLTRGHSSLEIGVLLPITGPHARNYDKVLNEATRVINDGGGIGGRKIELLYRDTGDIHGDEIRKAAADFLESKSIDIVIGPLSSENMFTLAPLFIEKKKVLISPTATSAEIFRAFGGEKYIWRTCQSDIAQIRTMLHVLDSRGVKKVAMISQEGPYGQTFCEWSGFFANEMGIELDYQGRLESGSGRISNVLDEALEGDPEYLVCAVPTEEAVGIKKELDSRKEPVNVFFADVARTKYLLENLLDEAIGTEYMSPAADPASGFADILESELTSAKSGFAAATYDAFLIAVCTLARREYSSGGFFDYVLGKKEPIAESIDVVVSGRETAVTWKEPLEAVELILKGETPDFSGASGPLDFDAEDGVDPLTTFYSLDTVEAVNGSVKFRNEQVISSNDSLYAGVTTAGASAGRVKASDRFLANEEFKESTGLRFAKRKDLWALIVATSSTWENYRHQADALAMYDMIRNNGVADDKIVLFLVDDIAGDEKNPVKGNVHVVRDGPNLREGARIDYRGNEVTPVNVLKALKGERTKETPEVLGSNENSNVLLFIIGHGSPGAFVFAGGGLLSGEDIAGAIEQMRSEKKFRKMLVIGDACYSESMGAGIETPGVLYFAAAASNESALGATYDPEIDAWLNEDFSYEMLRVIEEEPDVTLSELYTTVFEKVSGSHVRLLNASVFGNVLAEGVKGFTTP